MNIENMCQQLINGLEHNEELRAMLSKEGYIKEFRTIGLNVPRRTGKTTLLKYLHSITSSVLFVPNQTQADNLRDYSARIVTFQGIKYFSEGFRGRRPQGLKYTNFYVDEPGMLSQDHKELMRRLLSELSALNMLSENFFILQLGTA